MYHLMSVLGTGNYKESSYSWKDEAEGSADDCVCVTRFVQIASLQKILQEHPGEAVKVSIFLTEKARKVNWENRILEETKEEKGLFRTKKVTVTENLTGLESALKDFQEKNAGSEIEIEAVAIPEGRIKTEQDEIFNSMFQCMGQEEEIYFDLTHGFRSIPMLALTVVDYARAVKKIRVGGLYYGAYEAKDEKTGLVPIFDMTYCDSILRWTGAAESFITSGSSNQLLKVYRGTAGKDEPEELRRMVESLNDLTNCLETSRGRNVDETVEEGRKKSIRRAYIVFKDQFDQINRNQSVSAQAALQNLFALIAEDRKIFDLQIRPKGSDTVLEQTSIGICAIRWAIDKNLTQQGLTALEATITTFIGEFCGFPMGKYDNRELISTALLGFPAKNPADAQKVLDMRNTIKTEIKQPKDLKKICRKIKNLRNSINHFGVEDTNSYEVLKDELIIGFQEFIKIVSEDCV